LGAENHSLVMCPELFRDTFMSTHSVTVGSYYLPTVESEFTQVNWKC